MWPGGYHVGVTSTRHRDDADHATPSENGQDDNDQQGTPDQLSETLERTVDEGVFRLTRSWPALLATGLVGGADVTLGVFAFLVVDSESHNVLAASLAFAIGFVALTLASSELFTENYLVPIAAVVAG